MFRRLRHRLKFRHCLALVVIAAAAVSAPRIWRARFVTERRAALHLRRAEHHLASREFDGAREEFRAALRLQPANAEARRQLAETELTAGNWELAFVEIESLTAAHPEDAEAGIRLAELMVKLGFLEAPEAALDRVIDAAPARADARGLRGEIRFRLGRYFGAMSDAEAAVAAAPASPAAWRLLVRSTARSRGADAGIEAAQRGLAAVGRVPELVLPLAGLLTAAGRVQEASDFLAGMDGGSGQPGAAPADQVARVRTRLRAGDPAGARKMLLEMTEPELGPLPAAPRRLRPDAESEAGSLGAWTREHWPGRLAQLRHALEAQLRQKNWVEAQRIADAARRTYPETAFAAFLAGILEVSRDNADAAEAHFLEALALAPRFPTVVAALAKTWARHHGAAGAGDRLMQLAEGDPGFSSARSIAARAYLEARDPAHAEAALRRGLELQPDSPAPYQQLADHYLGLDRTPEALGDCEQGLNRFPGDIALRLTLAQINASLGRLPEAARAYQAVLSARPDRDLVAYRLAMLLASQDQGAALDRRAAQILDELQGDLPSDPMLLDVLGWLHFRAGDARKARQLLTAVVKDVPEEPRPHVHLAAVYLHEHEPDLARKELNAALASGRPFAERLDVLRMLRSDAGSGTRGSATIAPVRH